MTKRLEVPLLGPLSAVLPSREQTQLLRTCLWSGEPAAEAWRQWTHEITDFNAFLRQDADGVKGLLPLLFQSLQDKMVFVDKEFHTYLRTAYLRDELRSRSYSRICRAVTSTLTTAGISTVVLKGAALAETAYDNPALQHAHYLDVLIKDYDLTRALKILRSMEFVYPSTAPGSEWQSVELVHESGLPLVLYPHLFRLPFYHVHMNEIWERTQVDLIDGIETRLLSPADNLVHLCGSVFDIDRHEPIRWVCDAWFLIHRYPDLDWDVVLDYAIRSHMALPLFVTINYLAEALHAPIPTAVLNRLRYAASRSEPIGREVALFGALRNSRGGLIKVLQCCGDWSTRVLVLKWALFPSFECVRWLHEITYSWVVPFYYPYRPLRFLVRQLWFFSRRHIHLASRVAQQENLT